MKTIGLIGGMSWESSLVYYRLINETMKDRLDVHRIIYDELCLGQVKQESKERYCRIMGNLVRQGAEGIILGCTEIGLLVGAEDCAVLVFDTTKIHAEAAVELALR